jgi:hypothetical protein
MASGRDFLEHSCCGWEENPNVDLLSGLKNCTDDMNKLGKLQNKYRIVIDECREEID